MNLNRLLQRVPSAVKVSNAFPPGYKLICNKESKDGSAKANIIKTDISDDLVWGVLFNIHSKEKTLLDKEEGLGFGYNEDTLTFWDQLNNSYSAQISIADSNSISSHLLSFDWYKEFIVTGGIQNKLPADYISQLQSIPCIPDPNEMRRLKNYSILSGASSILLLSAFKSLVIFRCDAPFIVLFFYHQRPGAVHLSYFFSACGK